MRGCGTLFLGCASSQTFHPMRGIPKLIPTSCLSGPLSFQALRIESLAGNAAMVWEKGRN